ncbi:MAG TPA: FAD-dependent oxidoreductase [Desulfobacterales bacterium]|nr:FAD-dependent oxidoreductase [Desulfobacterales bacterium]
MKRFLFTPGHEQETFDLLIVGGGVYGAAMAYYASLANLTVALFEKEDFCAHTSANSQKVIHGGLRYLQSFDIKRVVESIRERQRFYALFPHLVQPLPCVLPVSGWGTKSREAMSAAFFVYRILQSFVCRGGLTAHGDKSPRMLSAQETVSMFPHLQTKKLRGGALWYDGLCVEPERVVMSLLKSAAGKGASIANYVKVNEIKRINDDILSVSLQDRLSGKESEIKAGKIALCTGPWFKETFKFASLPEELEKLTLISGVNVVTNPLTDSRASIALKSEKPENSRLMFVLPWKKYSIAGTIWEEGGDSPSQSFAKTETGTQLNSAVHETYPASMQPPAKLRSHFGYVPGEKGSNKHPADRILSHYKLVSREKEKQDDVIQVVGVKFTTVFDVTLKALAKLFPEQRFSDTIATDTLPVGSPQDSPETHLKLLQKRYGTTFSPELITMLFGILGTELSAVLEKYVLPGLKEEDEKKSYYHLLRGLTRFFIEEEMVVSLVDLIHRHFFPGMPGLPEADELEVIALEMTSLLDWSDAERDKELEKVRSFAKSC